MIVIMTSSEYPIVAIHSVGTSEWSGWSIASQTWLHIIIIIDSIMETWNTTTLRPKYEETGEDQLYSWPNNTYPAPYCVDVASHPKHDKPSIVIGRSSCNQTWQVEIHSKLAFQSENHLWIVHFPAKDVWWNRRVYIPVNPIKSPCSYGFPMVFLWFSYKKSPFHLHFGEFSQLHALSSVSLSFSVTTTSPDVTDTCWTDVPRKI